MLGDGGTGGAERGQGWPCPVTSMKTSLQRGCRTPFWRSQCPRHTGHTCVTNVGLLLGGGAGAKSGAAARGILM